MKTSFAGLLRVAAAATMALSFSQAASATTVIVDNFAGPAVLLTSAGLPLGHTTTSNDSARTASLKLTQKSFPFSLGALMVDSGYLSASNGSGANTVDTLSWNLAPNAGLHSVVLQLGVALADNWVNAAFSLNGNSLGSQIIAAGTTNQTASFALTPAQAAALSGGGSLALTLSGPSGWDATFTSVSFNAGAVPEPASWMLLGIGLFGAGAHLRRRGASLARA